MTQLTPPGWYPDPGQKSDGPATERWWDGGAWTEQTRPTGSAAPWGPPAPSAGGAYPAPAGYPGAPAQFGHPGPQGYPGAPGAGYPGYPGQPGHPGYPGYPGYPGAAPAPQRRGLRTGIAVGVAAAVLASIGVGVFVLTKDDGGSPSRADSQGQDGRPGPFGDDGSGGPDDRSPSPEAPRSPEEEDPERGLPEVPGGGTLQDPLNGISMPVPQGWSGRTNRAGAAMGSDDTYDCPGTPGQLCTKGGAYSAAAEDLGATGTTPEAIAKNDIARNAAESYGNSYGRITSHQELLSKAVTVAGQKGYVVRWKAVTSKGSDGYVQSLVFPSPADPENEMIIVRFGLDTDQKLSIMDEITAGIKKFSGGTGSGQNV
ncbi:DUF2510 domain-containing protein [Streptomyces sp. NPDC058739]|uniref:DUF2510 domain-containing protein n=1 Tax=Streptomyces sp. NPDC058739 TaxID=3346618 RepID=UPI00367B540C